jgi:molecular chaperone DnaK (HSP70)
VHTLGVQWHDPQTGRLENVVLVPRGSELPCGTVAAATTDEENQSSIVLRLLEGESRAAGECAPIAQVTIRDLPAGLPKGTRIDVRYQFTAEGRLQVRAQLPETGQALAISVRREKGLSESQISEWRQLLARPVPAGLKAIHAVLAKHQSQREEAGEASPTAAAAAAAPSATTTPSGEVAEFTLETAGSPTTTRLRRRRMTPRRLAIFVGGYLVSALLGTAIGYYVLMRIDPSYNWWHLKLPGLREAPASSAGAL